MKLLNRLERIFGRYAIRGLMKYVMILYVLGMAVGSFLPTIYINYLALDFAQVARGQVWRLITFIIPVSNISGVFFVLIMAYFYFMIGNSLENAWGAFRLNLYFFSGIFFNIIANFIIYLVNMLMGK